MPRSTWLNILIILLVIIAASYLAQIVWSLFSGLGDIILLLLLSWLISYALSPLVDGLSDRAVFASLIPSTKSNNTPEIVRTLREFRITRPLAVAIVYLAVVILLVIAIASVIPAIVAQVNAIVPQLSNIDALEVMFTSVAQSVFQRFNLSFNLATLIDSAFAGLQSIANPLLQNTVSILTSVLGLLGNALLVILFSFFLALDGPRFTTMLFDVMPQRLHQETRMFLVTTDRAFGGFLRSQILQAGAIGLGTGVILSVFGIQAPVLSGVFAGVAMLIPLLGPVLSFIPPLVATLLTDPGKFLLVMIPIVILQVVVVNVIMPRIMGNALGLHPLVIILSLLVGVKVAGFWGAFFAMPLAGIISAFGAFLIRRRQRLTELTSAIVQDNPDPPPVDAGTLAEQALEASINPTSKSESRV